MKVGVIGAGTMGAGIAQVAAHGGEEVFLYDADPSALQRAGKNIHEGFRKLVEKGKLDAKAADAVMKRIYLVPSPKELASCDLIIEAIVEDLAVKRKLFSDLETIVTERCILGTNTSSLSIASVAASCRIPARVIGIHFFNPAPIMPLVEIIPGLRTVDNLAPLCMEIMKKWGKVPVLAKDMPGFIVNRLARSFYGESIRIFEEGIADCATIDWALKEIGGFRMGPFELMDLIGNDVNYKVTESVWEQFFYEPRFKPSITQKRLYESGMFGRKSGRGYYNYAEGAVLPSPNKDPELGKQIFLRVIAMLINEAADAFYLKLASREDLDLAVTKGVNYPKGLLKWCDELGAEVICRQLQTLFDAYGEDRYRPCLQLKLNAAGKKTFY